MAATVTPGSHHRLVWHPVNGDCRVSGIVVELIAVARNGSVYWRLGHTVTKATSEEWARMVGDEG